MMNYEFMKKFKPDENTVKEFDYWIVTIRERQITLGSMIIILKREVSSLGEVTPEEMAELPKVAHWFENVTRDLFGAEKFNYVIAMMKDNFVHYHAIPRYSRKINAYGSEWNDESWPGLIQFKGIDINKDINSLIIKDIREFKE